MWRDVAERMGGGLFLVPGRVVLDVVTFWPRLALPTYTQLQLTIARARGACLRRRLEKEEEGNLAADFGGVSQANLSCV